ncbi:MAG: bifunctional nuclease family protein [Anaerolineae bacterium]|nr:bifunctional nuclease family protein [Anaerolineae bacterium]
MIELSVYAVLYSLLSRYRVVLLKAVREERYLPIWIGMHESEAIAIKLQGAKVPRPLTHDLLNNVITKLDGTLQYIEVNDLSEHTFYARLAVERHGDLVMIDSRPSDAIALAVRASVPIYAEESVMDEAGIYPSPEIREAKAESADESLGVFRDLLDSIDSDDRE